MRPHKLRIENFGPYREATLVDFDRLGPVFLVWGKTGSGKTTIFDALTYALYGQVAGSRNGLERQLWSQHAKPGEKPRVEFEFDLGGEGWKVERRPPHRKIGRGGEEREVPAEAVCWRLEGGQWNLVANKIGEVDATIRGRLGLSMDEFSKIVLLPQGEFQRFLEMDSSDRVSILEKLFPVDLHDAVTELARQGARAASDALKHMDVELERLREEARVSGLSIEGVEGERGREAGAALVQDLEAARAASLKALVDAEKALAQGLDDERRAENAKAARARLAVFEAGIGAAAERRRRLEAAGRAARVSPLLDAAALSAAVLAGEKALALERRSALIAIEAGAGEALAKRQEAAAADETRALVDRELGELKKALETWTKALLAERSLEKAVGAREAKMLLLDEALAAEEAAKAKAADHILLPDEEEAITAAWEAANFVFEKAKSREALLLDAWSKARDVTLIEAELAEAREGFAGIDGLLARRLAERDSDAASHLALSLRPGEACPVCGSHDHPLPARAASPVKPAGLAAGKAGGREAGADSIEEVSKKRDGAFSRLSALRQALRSKRGELRLSQRAVSSPSGSPHAPDMLGAPDAPDALDALDAPVVAFGSASGGRLEPLDEDDSPIPALPPLEEARSARVAAERGAQEAARIFRGLGERRGARASTAAAFEEARSLREKAAAAHAEALAEENRQRTELEAARSHAGGVDPSPRIAELTRLREVAEEGGRRALEAAEGWAREVGAAEARVAESEARIPALEEDARRSAERAEAAMREAGFPNEGEARAAFMPARELGALEVEVADHERGLSEARAAVSEAEKALGAVTSFDAAALQAAVRTAEEGYADVQRRYEAAREDLLRFDRMAGELTQRSADRRELSERSGRLAGLSALLAGDLPGRRLPFKNFVLGLYFREVVARASIRLAHMTDSRYGLAADEASATGRGRIGLELLVLDSYTGRSRAPGTLSGGERFLTSLALALSLGDTIRSRSGGASLDAVFIDEGFGSLDEEALDRAVAALDLARGARMIGIISHVPELRSRIPSRIEVEKGKKGSRLEIV